MFVLVQENIHGITIRVS